MLHVVRRALLVAIFSSAMLPGVASAWYVDLSITGAGRIYETTDANEIDEHCEDAIEGFASPSTTPTGTVGATCRAGSADGDYGSGWVVRYVAEAAAGYRFDGWVSDGRTNPGPVLCDGSNGSSSYSGAACQFATHANLQTRARFVDDTNPAMSSLTGPNRVVNGPATFTFSASADPTFSHFECQVPGVHGWQTCSSGRQEDPPTGTYTFHVRAVDRSNNRSTEMTTQWEVDKIKPETTLLTSGPNGLSRSTTAQFDFTSNEAGDFVCSLDGGAPTTCGSGKTYTGLGQGPHTFSVAARDAAGNVDASPATRSFTVDTVAPNTTLASSGPSGPTNSPNASFTFSSEPNATFTCTLNGEDSPCNSGVKTYNGLPDGSYTFTVAATDQAGNPDASPATRTFTVDTVAPNTTLDAGPSGSTTSRTARFEFSSPDGTATFRCSLDGAAPTPCTSPVDLSGLAVGSHTFSVSAVDPATNADTSPATRTWTIVNPPPPDPEPDPGDSGGSDTPSGTGGSGGGTSAPQPQPQTTPITIQPSIGAPSIKGASRGTARLDRRGRFTIPGLRVSCPTACTVSVRIIGTPPARRAVASAKRLVLASARVKPSRSGTLKVRLTKKGLAAVRRAKRLRTTVVVTVTPSGGGAKVTKRLTVTLRAPRR